MSQERSPLRNADPSAAERSTSAAPRSGRARRFWMIAAGLSLLYLVGRVPHLTALPIFGDEAIYLRWAQVIRGEGITGGGLHPWVSLADPKPPLHFWLIATVFHWAGDPLMAARLLSVLAGAACMPLMMLIGCEWTSLMAWRPKQIGGVALGALAAVLALFCPFLAFYQRLATADALFIAESLLIVWLSLRWARLTWEMPQRHGWWTAVALGAALGAGLLTRQGVSYTICVFPAAAWLVRLGMGRKRGQAETETVAPERWFRRMARAAGQLGVAAVVAGVLWMPYLTAQLDPMALNLREKDQPGVAVSTAERVAEVKRRIFYQASFTQAGGSRAALVQRNLFETFVPGWNEEGRWNSGWMPLYMTPLAFLICVVGTVYMALRQWRMAVLVLTWLVLLLGPLVLLADTLYSRYVVVGVVPLLFCGAYLLGDTVVLLARMPGKRAMFVGWPIVVALAGTVLYWPGRELGRQIFDWPAQQLVEGGTSSRDFLMNALHEFHHRFPSDRTQYLTGWTSGSASGAAIAYVRDQARAHPERSTVVITTAAWGLPDDAAWVYLTQESNVQMYYTGNARILRPGSQSGTYLLRKDKWLFTPEEDVRLPADAMIYFVTNDPVHGTMDVPAFLFYKGKNPNLQSGKTFYGIEGRKGDAVTVFALARPRG